MAGYPSAVKAWDCEQDPTDITNDWYEVAHHTATPVLLSSQPDLACDAGGEYRRDQFLASPRPCHKSSVGCLATAVERVEDCIPTARRR